MGLNQLGRFEQTARLTLTFAGFLLAWEIFSRVLAIPPYILPPPSQILFDLWRRLPRLASAAGYTLQPMVLGFLAAVVFGVALALVIAFSRRLEGVIYPLLVFVVTVVLAVLPTIGSVRYRAPAEIPLVILAAVALEAALGAVRHRRGRVAARI